MASPEGYEINEDISIKDGITDQAQIDRVLDKKAAKIEGGQFKYESRTDLEDIQVAVKSMKLKPQQHLPMNQA